MKKFLIFLLLISSTVFSQTNAEEKLMDKLCKESCDAINNTDFESGNDKGDITTKLGFALINVYNNNSREIKRVYGYDITKPEDAQRMGEKLGAVLVFKCPKFKDIVFKISDSENIEASLSKNSGDEQISQQGFIQKIDCNELCSLIFKTEEGEQLKMYRFEKFPGSEFLDQFSSTDKGKKLSITYKNKNVFMGSAQKYQSIKIITAIVY